MTDSQFCGIPDTTCLLTCLFSFYRQLHIAIVHGFYDAVLALLHMCPHPALLDICNDAGRAPIHLAVLTSQPHIARRLLIAGAKV